MKKFVVMYRVPVETMEEWKKNTSPEDIKAQTDKLGVEMPAWIKKNQKRITDMGWPLGKNTRLTSAGAHAVPNDLNYYQVVEANTPEEVVEMFKDNPHFTIPTAFLDIMEVSHPGL